MSRIVLVLNHHAAPSETFQRLLAVGLAEAGHDVVIHGLLGEPPADGDLHPRVRYSSGLPTQAEPGHLVAQLARRRGAGAHLTARLAMERFGRTARAARAAALAGPILEQRPEVVHLGFSAIGLDFEDALDILDGIPLVVSCRGTEELVRSALDPARGQVLGRVLGRAAIVHCVADAVADAAVELGADPAAIRVIRPGIDLERFSSGPRPAPHAPWRLVTTTRLVPGKGVDDLLTAVAIAADAGVAVQARVLGDGPVQDDLRLRALRLGVADRVELVGEVGPTWVRDELAAAHLYLSPSLSEGISNGVLEAMAVGVPTVSTAVGGMHEVITDGVDGWLVAPGRPDRLAAAVMAALADADGLAAVGAAGRARVARAFGRDTHLRAWQGVYAELLGPAPSVSEAPQRKEPHQ